MPSHIDLNKYDPLGVLDSTQINELSHDQLERLKQLADPDILLDDLGNIIVGSEEMRKN